MNKSISIFSRSFSCLGSHHLIFMGVGKEEIKKKSGSEIAKNNSAGRETENSTNFVKKISYPGFEATFLPPH